MSRFEEQIKRIVQTLGLKNTPVGAKFSETPDRRGINRQFRICEALDVARRKKATVNLSKDNCVCRGGCHIAGWQALSTEELSAIFLARASNIIRNAMRFGSQV